MNTHEKMVAAIWARVSTPDQGKLRRWCDQYSRAKASSCLRSMYLKLTGLTPRLKSVFKIPWSFIQHG